jgi:hypothetical protein
MPSLERFLTPCSANPAAAAERSGPRGAPPGQAAIGSPACCQASTPPRIAFTFANSRPWNLAA